MSVSSSGSFSWHSEEALERPWGRSNSTPEGSADLRMQATLCQGQRPVRAGIRSVVWESSLGLGKDETQGRRA